MGKATEEILSPVRSIVGDEFSDMDIIRALHMANNDPTAAINIIFDTPRSFRKPGFSKKSEPSNSKRNAEPPGIASSDKQNGNPVGNSVSELNNSVPRNEVEGNGSTASGLAEEMGSGWWFVGNAEVVAISTCRGRILKTGDAVSFTFPVEKKSAIPSPGKLPGGRVRQVATSSEIARFSTNSYGEAEFSPGDLYIRKRPLGAEDNSVLPPSFVRINKIKSTLYGNGKNVENEESISDDDIDNIVGVTTPRR